MAESFRCRRSGVFGSRSEEFWKPYAHPTKFEGLLPVLWREDDVTIYRIPQRTASLAHVVPESAIVLRKPGGARDIGALEAYGAALDDPALPAAGLQWEGRNRIRIAARTPCRGRPCRSRFHSIPAGTPR